MMAGRNTLNKVFCEIKPDPLSLQHTQPAANELAVLATPPQTDICNNPVYSHLQWIKFQNCKQLKTCEQFSPINSQKWALRVF